MLYISSPRGTKRRSINDNAIKIIQSSQEKKRKIDSIIPKPPFSAGDLDGKRFKSYNVKYTWPNEFIAGMKISQYNRKTIKDRKMQENILKYKIKTIIDKAFELRIVLDRGFKVII